MLKKRLVLIEVSEAGLAHLDPKAEQIATTKGGAEEPSTSGLRRAPSQIFGDSGSMPKTKKQKLAVTDSQP